jgi:hypothetical protein
MIDYVPGYVPCFFCSGRDFKESVQASRASVCICSTFLSASCKNGIICVHPGPETSSGGRSTPKNQTLVTTTSTSNKTRHGQPALHLSHLRARRLVLRDVHAVVDVQCAGRRVVRVGRDDELEVLRAELRRHHRDFRGAGAPRCRGCTVEIW